MNVAQEYYTLLKKQSISVFEESINLREIIGECNDIKSNLKIWYNLTIQYKSSEMLSNALEELDISCLHLLFGFYRSSFKSLRLSLEMICGAIYYSALDLEYTEWKQGTRDLVWSKLTCNENGILSRRFANAYFPELNNELENFTYLTKGLYRKLSEMVHGNYNTWNTDNPKIEIRKDLIKKYKKSIESLSKILNFVFCLKHLKRLSPEEKEQIESYLSNSIGHIESIRTEIGGPQ